MDVPGWLLSPLIFTVSVGTGITSTRERLLGLFGLRADLTLVRYMDSVIKESKLLLLLLIFYLDKRATADQLLLHPFISKACEQNDFAKKPKTN